MEKQKVFIPVSVNDRSDPIPNKSNVIVLFDNNEVRRMNDSFPFAIATHWLNEQEGYFFTPEELKNIIGNAYAECFTNHGEDCSEDEYYKLKNEYIESLNIK